MTTPQQWENLIGLTATDADGDEEVRKEQIDEPEVDTRRGRER